MDILQQSIERLSTPVAEGTDAFYRANAQSYFDRTFSLSMDHLYRPFLEAVGARGRILDVGSGSGRDVKAFRALGYEAFGIEASPELAQLASSHVGPYFTVARVESFVTNERFDAIWACASLLHLPRAELYGTIRRLRGLLRPGGVFFATVQTGTGDLVQADGRRYTYYSAAEFEDAVSESGLQVQRAWESRDVMRPNGPRWINVIARRGVESTS
jgi:SAM-dependent methyltransferase